MYSSLLNNPEFTNVLMGLLAQKGVEVGDKETTNQFVELLKSNPEFLRSFLSGGGQEQEGGAVEGGAGIGGEEIHAPVGREVDVLQSGSMETVLHEVDGVNMGLSTAQVQFADLSMDNQAALGAEHVDLQLPIPEPLPTTAPIPQLRTTTATTVEPTPIPSQPPASAPVSYPPIPMPPPFIPSPIAHPTPPTERIQAFGFPPRMAPSQR